MTIQDDMQQDTPEACIRDIQSGALNYRRRIPITILGATSQTGQKLVCYLSKHRWFDIVSLTESAGLVGKGYGSIVTWDQDEPIPEKVVNLPLVPHHPERTRSHLVFSTLENDAGKSYEELFAKNGCIVISCTNNWDGSTSIPLIVSEASLERLELIKKQTYSKQGKIIGIPVSYDNTMQNSFGNALRVAEYLVKQGNVFW